MTAAVQLAACPGLRHNGDESSYRVGCRCPHTRAAAGRLQKRRRAGMHQPVLVPAIGSIRRLRALAVLGWTLNTIAADTGLSFDRLKQIRGAEHPSVRRDTAQAISASFERRCMTIGPCRRVRSDALRRGWHGPLTWNDDIDDPDARPDYGHGRPGNARQRVEQVAALVAAGWSPDAIADEIGCSPRTVHRLRGRVAS